MILANKEKAIIGLVEVDMNNNIGIIYLCPNFNMMVRDFVKHIKLVVQTKGYGQFQYSNIQLDVIFLGKTMNHINNNFKIQINGIIEALSSRGIKFLKPQEYNSEALTCLEWTLTLEESNPTLQPAESIMYKDRHGNLNVRFTGYNSATTSEAEDEENLDLMNQEIKNPLINH